jgi:hypothetical protein
MLSMSAPLSQKCFVPCYCDLLSASEKPPFPCDSAIIRVRSVRRVAVRNGPCSPEIR